MSEKVIQVPRGLTTDGLLGRRYLARFIDTLIVVLLVGFCFAVVFAGGSGSLESLLFLPVFLAIWIGYGSVLESSQWQGTVGKRIMGLRVYNADGGPLSLMQAAKRNLLKDGPFLALGMIPGGQLLVMLWLAAHLVVMHRSPVNQAIHDRFAGSWVAAPAEMTELRLS